MGNLKGLPLFKAVSLLAVWLWQVMDTFWESVISLQNGIVKIFVLTYKSVVESDEKNIVIPKPLYKCKLWQLQRIN